MSQRARLTSWLGIPIVDHPRVSGEHFYETGQGSEDQGSSPRERGARCRAAAAIR